MMTDDRGEYPDSDRLLARITPQQREEVRRRMAQGDIPYLPEDVKIEVGRVFFPGIGWNKIPGVDPAKLPLDDIELLFVVRRGEEFGLEVTLKLGEDAGLKGGIARPGKRRLRPLTPPPSPSSVP